MEEILRDVSFTGRILFQRRGFTLLCACVLGVGIGLTSALFNVVHTVVWAQLPYDQPDRLVSLDRRNPAKGWESVGATTHDFLYWRDKAKSFEGMATYRSYGPVLGGDGYAEKLFGSVVSHNFLDLLRVSPALGRSFSPNDARPEAESVVIIGHTLWQRRYQGNRNVVGRQVLIKGKPAAIVGVTPRGFKFPSADAELWVPFTSDRYDAEQSRFSQWRVFARLRTGVTMKEANTEMEGISRQLQEAYPVRNANLTAYVEPLKESFIWDQLKRRLQILFGATVLVLVMAIANASNLQIAFALGRRRELSIRSALGSSPASLVRLALTQSLMLSIVGTIAGLGIAYGASSFLDAHRDLLYFPFWADFRFDVNFLGFVVLITIMAGTLSGLIPALRISAGCDMSALRDDPRSSSQVTSSRLTGALITLQVIISCILLVGCMLTVRSVALIRGQHLDFDPSNILTTRVSLSKETYDSESRVYQFWETIQDRLRNRPDILDAAVAWTPPAGRWGSRYTPYVVEGKTYLSEDDYSNCGQNFISRTYFGTIRAPILRGRDFLPTDLPDRPLVGIVNNSFAEKEWPGEDSLGKRFRRPTSYFGRNIEKEEDWITVIGVVPDLHFRGLDGIGQDQAGVYLPISQYRTYANLFLIVKSRGNPIPVSQTVRKELAAIDPDVVMYRTNSLEAEHEDTIFDYRLSQYLFVIFGATGLILTSTGIFGLTAYWVYQRTREIGIRMALGAGRSSIVILVMGGAARLIGAGMVIGLLGAYLGRGFMSGFLFALDAADPSSYALTAGILIAVGALACLRPVWRAVNTQPADALRHE